MTDKTLDHHSEEGRFRTNDEIRVVDSTDGSVMHQPPLALDLKILMEDFYKFFNEEEDGQFIHPVLRACIIHFLIGFIHPFSDGNGRTARALFYWYMLKRGYWLTEYLSISGIILKSKTAYGKAFLYTESDDLDVTYFLNYKMRIIHLAYSNLRKYIQRKTDERQAAFLFMRNGGINERQAQILQWLTESPAKVITVKEVETRLNSSNQTARKDLQELVSLKFLEQRNVNKKKQVFIQSNQFDRQIKNLR
jgi:Fic family protein